MNLHSTEHVVRLLFTLMSVLYCYQFCGE